MATIEEIEDLNVEIINGIDNEEEEAKEVKEPNASSPARAEDADAAALVLTSVQEVEAYSDDEDDDVL